MLTLPAAEIKRRGLAALTDLLDQGAVHVVQRNRPACVVLSPAEYARLLAAASRPAPPDIWALLRAAPRPDADRDRADIDASLAAERAGWERP